MKDNPANQRLYFFGNGQADGTKELKHLIGGKGASLAEMTKAGLHVPAGFTLSVACCAGYHESGGTWPDGLRDEIRDGIARLESLTERRFGQGDQPLLVAVRSGAEISMPGMMDTILNVGLNPDCVRAIAERTGAPRAAWEAYRHVLVTFGETVGGVKEKVFRNIVVGLLEEFDVAGESELDAEQMEQLCERFRISYQRHCQKEMPTEPYEMLFHAVEAVFRSWHNERAVQYREHHQIEGLHGTAVTVQMMCPSEVSGVLFTAHPVNPKLKQMILEASLGLGEAVVLGKVTPDRFVIDRESGDIVERVITDKRTVFAGLDGNGDNVPSRDAPSLTDEQVQQLVELGQRVEEYFETPCDIEWGLAGEQFYLLQSRPIKYGEIAEAEERNILRREEIARLSQLAEPDGTVWSRYNLAEILAEPTPLTWDIVRWFMSGRGGFGQMYRDLGFDPDPALDDIGIFDLVCGRPYCNLSREPRMQYRRLPFEHPFAHLKKHPDKALYPAAVFNPRKATWKFWLLVPVQFALLFRSALKLRRVSRDFAQEFTDEIVPAFVVEVDKEMQADLHHLDATALLEMFHYWKKRTLYDFGRHSLKPTALAGVAMSNLERALARINTSTAARNQIPGTEPPLAETLEKARDKLRKLVMGIAADPEADLAGALQDLAVGKMDRQTFLKKFGHRGHQEMELSKPRWSEEPESLDRLMHTKDGDDTSDKDDDKRSAIDEELESPFAHYKLSPPQREALDRELRHLHTYLRLRETAKHHLMRGYFLLRKILVELDARYQLDGGIFFLMEEELPDLLAGEDFSEHITQRRRRRELLLSLPVPPVLFSDDLEAIGRPIDFDEASSLQGVPLSAGVAEGIALVLEQPPETIPDDDAYILVCPSTDPAWMPLFVNARGLVMETGGMLSHGAIVAREFSLPAVAGLPGIHRRVRSGQRILVDGSTGKVNILD